ncbi:MAG: HAD family hydrolase [Chloroflexota bacterium]
MSKIKIISFDLHETLSTPDFAVSVWDEGIPTVYAARCGISLEKAKEEVKREFAKVSDTEMEYYDLNYWSKLLNLGGYEKAIEHCKYRVAYYPETLPVLESLNKKYPLIIATGMPREFIPTILSRIEGYFTRVFSAYSDYNQFKTRSFYLTVCREMGIPPQEVVHVGDNWQKDVVIPKDIGIHAFHLDRKGNPDATTITSLEQLEEKIKSFS